MDAIIILTPKDYPLFGIMETADFEIKKNIHNQIIIQEYNKHVFINKDNSILSDYEKDEIELISKWNPAPDLYLLEYNDFDFIKKVLLKMNLSENVIVDDDHNNFYKGNEFIKKISNKNWTR